MKIQLDNSPAKLDIMTPHGSVEIEVWPGGQTCVTAQPNAEHLDECGGLDFGSRIVLKPRR